MLIPNKKQLYSENWKPLGQRKVETSFLLPMNNNIVHQCKVTWEIREDMDGPSWMLISSEKILAMENGVLPAGGNTEPLKSIHPKKIHGLPFQRIAFMSPRMLDDLAITSALVKAGFLSEVPYKEAEEILTNHVQNVEIYIKTGSCEPTIQSWIESHGGVGAERIKPRKSLHESTLDIFSCNIM